MAELEAGQRVRVYLHNEWREADQNPMREEYAGVGILTERVEGHDESPGEVWRLEWDTELWLTDAWAREPTEWVVYPCDALDVSPEESDIYCCQHCGQTERFRGTDSRMVGYQRVDMAVTGKREPLYDSYDSEIGHYTEIHCRDCDGLVWQELDPAKALRAACDTAVQALDTEDAADFFEEAYTALVDAINLYDETLGKGVRRERRVRRWHA